MNLYIKLIAAVAPAIVLAVLMIRRDKVRPEPIGWLLGAACLGVFSGFCVICLALLGWPQFEVTGYGTAILNSFVGAAFPEELCKLGMLGILLKYCKHFDEYIDGIVYSVCIGMGFAGFENIQYLLGEEEWLVMGISRALLSVPAHYFFAVAMGAFFSLAHFDKRNEKLFMIMAIGVPIFLHGLYDTLCFSIGINEEFAAAILMAFFVCFKWTRKYSKQLMESMLKLVSYGYPTK